LKPERWESLLVQEKYQEEMPVTERSISYNDDDDDDDNNIGLKNELCGCLKNINTEQLPWNVVN